MLKRHVVKSLCCAVLSLCLGTVAFAAAVSSTQSALKTSSVQVKPKAVVLSDVQLDTQISKKLRALVSKVAVAPLQSEIFVEIERQIKLDPALLESTLAGLSVVSEAFLDGVLDRGDNLSGLDEQRGKMSKEDPFGAGSSYSSSVGSLMQDLRERSNRFRGGQTPGGSPAQQMLGDKMNKLWGALDAVRGLGGETSFGAGGQDSGRISDPRGMAASGYRRVNGDNPSQDKTYQKDTSSHGQSGVRTTVTFVGAMGGSTGSARVKTEVVGEDGKTVRSTTVTTKSDEVIRATSSDGSVTENDKKAAQEAAAEAKKQKEEEEKKEAAKPAKAGGGHCPQDNCEGDHPEEAAQAVAVMQALGCAIGGVCPESSSDRISRMLGMSGRCDGRNGNSCSPMGVQHSVSPEELAERLGISDRSACDGRRDDVCGGGGGAGHAVAPLCMSSDICGSDGIIDSGLNARDLRSALQEGMSADLGTGGIGIALEFAGALPVTAHVVGNIRVVFDVPPGIADPD